MEPCVHIAGTADTKGAELAYLVQLVRAAGLTCRLVDLGTSPPTVPVDVPAEVVAACHPDAAAALATRDRGTAVAAMAQAFAIWARQNADQISGILAIGGGGGTSIASAGLRELPYGLPKLLVSTMASGQTAPYIGTSDIIMVPALTDLAGLNRLSRLVLNNAAQALIGMVRAGPPVKGADRPAIGLTMFGVTTPCVTAVSAALADRFDCLTFHATGIGGQTMERLLGDGVLTGLIDVTTTEIADLLCGGTLPALPTRLDVVAKTRAPWVGSLGAMDMVNFGPRASVPARFADRLFYQHNDQVTLMRTTVEENAKIGRWLAAKLNACTGPWRLVVPELGFSALDCAGQPFFDPVADAALIETLRANLTAADRLIALPLHINDPAFAQALAATYLSLQETT